MNNPSPRVPVFKRYPFDRKDYLLVAAIMALLGGFFWAIRGTSGYGGSTGGALAGLGWAMLWLLFSNVGGDGKLRPYGGARMAAAIVFGIAFGGMTGYGVYTAWVLGVYQMNEEVWREIGVWTGYGMLFLCGMHWGGVTGAFMAWCAPVRPMTWWLWGLRIGAGFLGAYLTVQVVTVLPQYFLPYYGEGYYAVAEYTTSTRAMHSLPNVMQHVGFFLGFLAFEIARRDWRAVKLMLVMALGFAIPFAVGGYWHTFRSVELALDWWKNWEMTIGVGGGLTFGLAFYLFNQPEDAAPRRQRWQELTLGFGVPVWFALGAVVLGAYEGFIRIHGLEDSLEPTRTPAFYLFHGIALLVLLYWGVRMYREEQTPLSNEAPVPMVVLGVIVGGIGVAGYLTSIPSAFRLANGVLVCLYTLYIGVSVGLYILFRRRQL